MLRILIVEDEPLIALDLQKHFKGRGFIVSSVSTGEDAIREVQETKPEVVLMDITL